MSFFRKTAAPDDKPSNDSVKTLQSRKDNELRTLGEIYYESTRAGRTDTKALSRKMKDLEKLDERLAVARGGKPAHPSAAHTEPPKRPKPQPCTKCGAALTPADRFCLQCGQPTPTQRSLRPCPNCNRGVEDAAKFCNHCGTNMTQAGRIRIRHPLTGQEASFDFQPSESGVTMRSYEPEPVDQAPMAFEEPPEPVEDVDPEKSWIRELERFARPSHSDVQMFLNRGRDLLQSGRHREAAIEFEAAILQNARDARAHYYLGVARYKGGDLDSAIDAFGRCVRLERNNSDAYNDLGLCYAKKAQWRESLENYMSALRLNPEHSDAHYNVAHLFITQGAYPDAIHHLEMYLQNSPRAHDFKRVTEMIEQLQMAVRSGARMGPDSMLPQH